MLKIKINTNTNNTNLKSITSFEFIITWYLLKANTNVSNINPKYGTSSVVASSSKVANAEHAASWTLLLGSNILLSN